MSDDKTLGAIHQSDKSDYLFRVSIKALVVNDDGDILVVKESSRNWWDVPGGGMEHGETVKDAIRRELREEVSLRGDFEYEIISIEDPGLLQRLNAWQMRIVFVVKPKDATFAPGDDGDEILFINPEELRTSKIDSEIEIYNYWNRAKQRKLI